MRPVLALSFAIALVAFLPGCQPALGANLPGTWLASGGGSMVLSKDGKFILTANGEQMNGSWTLTEKTVTFKVSDIKGKPIKEAITEVENNLYMVPPEQTANVQKMVDAMKMIEKDGISGTVSEDGKVMTTDVGGQKQTWNKKEK